MPPEEGSLDGVERWFLRRGLPHLIDDRVAQREALGRARRVLLPLFLLSLLNGANAGYTWWQNALAMAGSLAILVASWAGANVVQGRPVASVPATIGPFEVAVLVLAPAVPPLVFGFQWASALVGSLVALVVVAAVLSGTSFGLVPMTRWALGRLAVQLGAVVGLAARALPLLLVFQTFLFVNAEVWQVAGTLAGPPYPLTLALFLGLAAVFVVAKVPVQVRSLARFDSADDVVSAAAGSWPGSDPPPAPDLVRAGELGRRQWVNVGLVLVFSQAVQVALVASVVGAFFVLFGFLAIPEATALAWTGADARADGVGVLWQVSLGGRQLVLTEALLRVSGFLATFTAMYFAVTATTDATYRAEFHDDVVTEVREALAVRAMYLGRPPAGDDRSSRD